MDKSVLPHGHSNACLCGSGGVHTRMHARTHVHTPCSSSPIWHMHANFLGQGGRVPDTCTMYSMAGAVGSRWQGRLEEGPFTWSPQGDVFLQHDAWLRSMDMSKCGLASLQAPHLSTPAFLADLEAAKVQQRFHRMHCKFAGGVFDSASIRTPPCWHANERYYRTSRTCAS